VRRSRESDALDKNCGATVRAQRAHGLAVVATATALLVRVALTSWIGDRPLLILFVIPIILSADAGGLGPGLLSTLLVALATDYFVMPPVFSFLIDQPVDIVHWLTLILTGALISVLSGALRARASDARANPPPPSSYPTSRTCDSVSGLPSR